MYHPTQIRKSLRHVFQFLAVVTLAVLVMWLLNSLLGESSASRHPPPQNAGTLQSVGSPTQALVPQQEI